MPIKDYNFPIDHFGLVISPVIARLLNQDSNKRLRKSALKSLVQIAKGSRQLPRDVTPQFVGLRVDCAGQLWLSFTTGKEEPREDPISS